MPYLQRGIVKLTYEDFLLLPVGAESYREALDWIVESDEAELRRMGVSRVVLAEHEVGNELVRHALRRYGISERELDAIVRRAR